MLLQICKINIFILFRAFLKDFSVKHRPLPKIALCHLPDSKLPKPNQEYQNLTIPSLTGYTIDFTTYQGFAKDGGSEEKPLLAKLKIISRSCDLLPDLCGSALCLPTPNPDI